VINTLFTRAKVLARFRQSLLQPHLSDLAARLHERGYSLHVIRGYLCTAEKFGQWLAINNLNTSDVNDDLIRRYVGETVRPHAPLAERGSDGKVRTGLGHLVRILRQKQVIPPVAVMPAHTAAERWLMVFDQHLVQVAGAALNTRKKYVALARRFIATQFGDGPLDWGSLQADDVASFVTREAETKRGFGRKAAPVAIRAVLRFLVYSGEIRTGLAAAVPAMRNWKHAALPRHVSTNDLECVLNLFRDASPRSRRNLAILWLFARLGLRANEVVQLQLGDIDWRGARLVLRCGKKRIERVLPLSQEVGHALAEYVTKARPRTGSPVVFLNYRPPYRPLAGPSAVSTMAKRALLSVGFTPGPRIGAHNFRHTVASEMVSKGATFKEVADVLGHESLQTTGIYAKLDLQALTAVALPWIGGEKRRPPN
jgi:site-specific recombinase XerD